ncbi:MAG: hypothetical protein HQK50_11550, partial [Oligoflexia bacterium]|nr:hypothetical protein [Oligoflexia bacterium]
MIKKSLVIITCLISEVGFSDDDIDFYRATNFYGKSVVTEGTFVATSTIIPWSSYWFPTKDPILFMGENSPLKKYDRFVEHVTGINPYASKFEEEQLFDPEAASWSGLCTAWALVSIMEKEPPASVQFKLSDNDVLDFSSGDLKALLMQTYTKVEQARDEIYGQRYDGQFDSIYADIYADQFHRLLQEML